MHQIVFYLLVGLFLYLILKLGLREITPRLLLARRSFRLGLGDTLELNGTLARLVHVLNIKIWDLTFNLLVC